MTEADPQTFVPQVSLQKLGKLDSVEESKSGHCSVSLTLRQDFWFDEHEEVQMRELCALTKQGYLGDGVYKMPLTEFSECYVEVQ